jgi:ribosomal protein L35AE/L33A
MKLNGNDGNNGKYEDGKVTAIHQEAGIVAERFASRALNYDIGKL